MVQIIVLAAVAFFLFWRLKSVLGSRQGFEIQNKIQIINQTQQIKTVKAKKMRIL